MFKDYYNIPVYPYLELLQEEEGLSIAKGGPLWPNWEDAGFARHCRNQGQPVDSAPVEKDCTRILEKGIWCGPIAELLPQQIAEFSFRMIQALEAGDNLPLIFATRETDKYASIDKAPEHFKALLNWFGVASRVILITTPTLVKSLRVYLDAEPRESNQISPSILNFLDKTIKLKKLDWQSPPVVFVSRSKFARNRFAGESYLERFLITQGVSVMWPEMLGLQEQLRRYSTPTKLVLVEGSALQTTRLLKTMEDVLLLTGVESGDRLCQQICERSRKFENISVSKNCLKITNLFGEACPSQDLQILDESQALLVIDKLGLSRMHWNSFEFHENIKFDIQQWLMQQGKQILVPPGSVSKIKSELTKAGLGELIAEVDTYLYNEKGLVKGKSEYRRALELANARLLEQAVTTIKTVIKQNPQVPGLLVQKSAWEAKLGQLAEARESMKKALSIAPKDPYLYMHAAKVAEDNDATGWIDKAIQLNPAIPSFYYEKSLILEKLQQLPESIKLAQEAVYHSPNNPYYRYTVARLAWLANEFMLALSNIDGALSLNYKYPEYHKLRCNILLALNRKQEAQFAARTALELDLTSSDLRLFLAEVLNKVGDWEGALFNIEEALLQEAGNQQLIHKRREYLQVKE